MKFSILVTLASLLAISQCGVLPEPHEVTPYSLIDPIIKAILEALKPKLKDLTLPDINETIRENSLSANILIKNILVKNADKFVIKTLKSKIAPLQLTNLTLTWADITASAAYDIDANLTISNNSSPLALFAKGDARASLNDIFFTIGAKCDLKNGALQIKPKGLFGFDFIIKKANVTLTSILGNSELGRALGVFVSQLIPQVIETFKKPVFEAYQDDIIKVINQVLKKNGTTVMDEEPAFEEVPVFQTLDLTGELGNILRENLNL